MSTSRAPHALRWRAGLIALLVVAITATGLVGSAMPAAAATWVDDENSLQGTTQWFVSPADTAREGDLSGYPTKASVLPGETLELKIHNAVSTTQRVIAYRLGWYDGAGGREVMVSDWLPAIKQPDPVLVATVDGRRVNRVDASAWRVAASLNTTGWLPGTYSLVVEADTGERTMIPFTVRSPSLTGKTVIVNATATWQAYNRYGGYSAYYGLNPSTGALTTADRSRQVSMNRPLNRNHGVQHFLVMERGLIAEAERTGLDLGYVSNVDLSAPRATTTLTGARAIVSLGHDEYWSNEHAATLTTMRDRGTNLLFAGANSMWWRIRWATDHRTYDIYKSATEDPVKDPTSATVNFTVPQSLRLLGSRYVCSGVNAPLVVTDPTAFFFAGTGARAGSSYPGLNRVEVDRARLSTDNPATLSIAAHSPVSCGGMTTDADLTWYVAPSRAGVITLGSMGFALAADPLNRDAYPLPPESVAFATKVFANALKAVAPGPLGARHTPPANAVAVLQETAPLGVSTVRLGSATGSGVYGDIDGNRTADLIGRHRDGRLYLYTTTATGPRVTSTSVIGTGWERATWMGRVPDLNGDRVDELVARRDDGSLWLYQGFRGGGFAAPVRLGSGWNSYRAMVVVPDFLGDGKPVLLAVDSQGRMSRRSFTTLTSGLGSAVQIGHGWDPRFLLSVHNFIGDSRPNLVMILRDGRMFAYTLAGGTVRTYRQVGHGWTAFTHALVPGDIDGDSRWDLLGIRNDGNLYFYKNLAGGRWGGARQIGWNWRGMLTIF